MRIRADSVPQHWLHCSKWRSQSQGRRVRRLIFDSMVLLYGKSTVFKCVWQIYSILQLHYNFKRERGGVTNKWQHLPFAPRDPFFIWVATNYYLGYLVLRAPPGQRSAGFSGHGSACTQVMKYMLYTLWYPAIGETMDCWTEWTARLWIVLMVFSPHLLTCIRNHRAAIRAQKVNYILD